MDLSNAEEVNKALAMLAMRVSKLETDAPAIAVAGDSKNLGPVLAGALSNLKGLRTSLVTACSEIDGKVKELEKCKEENAKLKYQIMHLKRSLEAEEAKNAA